MTRLELNEIEFLINLLSKKINYELGVGNPYEGLYRTIRGKLVKIFDERYKEFVTTDTI